MSSLEQMAVRWALGASKSARQTSARTAVASFRRGQHVAQLTPSSWQRNEENSHRHGGVSRRRAFSSLGTEARLADRSASDNTREEAREENNASADIKDGQDAVEEAVDTTNGSESRNNSVEERPSNIDIEESFENDRPVDALASSQSTKSRLAFTEEDDEDSDDISKEIEGAFAAKNSSTNETSSEPSNSSYDPQNGSALDSLFTSQEDFEHEGPRSIRAQRDAATARRERQSVPRSVLGGILDGKSLQESQQAIGYDSTELNQEWGEDDTGETRQAPLYYERRAPTRNRSGSVMTASEQRIFREVFQRVLPGSFGSSDQQRSENLPFSLSRGALDYDVQREGPSNLKSLYERVLPVQDRKRQNASRKARRANVLLGEGPAVSRGISVEELEAGIDQAREELSACQSVQQIWEWAKINVWAPSQLEADVQATPQKIEEIGNAEAEESTISDSEQSTEPSERPNESGEPQAQSQGGTIESESEQPSDRGDNANHDDKLDAQVEDGAVSSDKEESVEQSDRVKQHNETTAEAKVAPTISNPSISSIDGESANDSAGPLARYGVLSPFYAPVVFIMHTQLRERFRAPHSALAVLRMVRRLGPESLVLGCTPDLYEGALRTTWTVLRDLEGTCELVKEARATGILTGEYNAKAEQASRMARRRDRESNDAESEEEAEELAEVRIARFIDTVNTEVTKEVWQSRRLLSPTFLENLDVKAGDGFDKHSLPQFLERRMALVKEISRLVPRPHSYIPGRNALHARGAKNVGGHDGHRQRTRTGRRRFGGTPPPPSGRRRSGNDSRSDGIPWLF